MTQTYESLRRDFTWAIPPDVNMGVLCADRHPADALGLIDVDPAGQVREYTFGWLAENSNRLGNALVGGLGLEHGDRIAIVLPQRVETGLAHLAIYKIGCVALPLSGLFGPEALSFRLGDSKARAVITDPDHLDVVREVANEIDAEVICVETAASPVHAFWDLVAAGSTALTPAPTNPETPALLIYTSGTTGTPKGALHGQRVLHGHLPGFDLSHDFFGHPDDVFWTPADWAWIGGLMDGLMPTWFHGRPIVATRRAKFDPEWALRTIAEHHVRNVFFPPTALKLMRQAKVEPNEYLRTIGSGGEPLGAEILDWSRDHLGVTINEFYGQTEANLLVGNCSNAWDVRAGSMGRPYPGHEVAVIDADGEPRATGEIGQIALRVPDPVAMLGYWKNAEATRAKYTRDGQWLLTGDLASMDGDGYIWYLSRDDDIINSGGYRIGPTEVEACLMRHPAVAMAAVIGVPDEVRGEAVKAFIVPADDAIPGKALEDEVRQLVRERLAAYSYPRQIEFVDALPMTTTGKIRRAALRAAAKD
jgi:acetyl-CoA synthetase